MPNYRFIFIVTYGRSGSTLLQSILNSIDGYKIRGENNNILLLLFRAHKRAVKARYTFGLRNTEANNPWFGADIIRPVSFGRGLAALFVDEIIVPDVGDKVLGFKEIRYLEAMEDLEEFLEFMTSVFAPAKVIFNIRKHSEVAKSGWWKKQDMATMMKTLEKFEEIMGNYHRNHITSSYIVDYNKYIKDASELKGLFEFLGEKLDIAQIEKILENKLKH